MTPLKTLVGTRTIVGIPVLGALLLYLAPTLLPTAQGFHALGDLLAGEADVPIRALAAFQRSAAVALFSALVATSFAGAATIVWFIGNDRDRRLVLFAALLPLFIPETSHALGYADFIAGIGSGKGLLANAGALAIYVLPFSAAIILLSAVSLPRSLGSAATDLGWTYWEAFRRVYLPLLWPSIAAGFVVSFLLAFNEVTRTSYAASRQMFSMYLAGGIQSGGRDEMYLIAAGLFVLGTFTVVLLSYFGSRRRAQ